MCASTIICSFVHLAANTTPKLVLCSRLVRKKYKNGDRKKNVRNKMLEGNNNHPADRVHAMGIMNLSFNNSSALGLLS